MLALFGEFDADESGDAASAFALLALLALDVRL